MGRSLLGLAVVVVASLPLHGQPTGNYRVVRPNAPTAEPQADKPGYLTIRPRGVGGKTQLVAAAGQPPAPPR